MRFAVSAPNVGDPSQLVELAVLAEGSGWDGFFLWDHLHMRRSLALDVHDPWVVLGAVAQVTTRIRHGTLVTPVSRRRPWKLAKEVTTLDHLSGARAVLGVGLGHPPDDDFGDFGDVADDRVRAELLDEGLTIIDRMLRGEPVRHDGRHFHVDADPLPPARQSPRPPLWVAGVAPMRRPLERALRYDGFVPIDESGQPMTAAGLEQYLAHTELPAHFDVVAPWSHSSSVADYAAVGATWLVESRWPEGDWMRELRDAVVAHPLH